MRSSKSKRKGEYDDRHCSHSYANQAISVLELFHESTLGKRWSTEEIRRPKKITRLPRVLSEHGCVSVSAWRQETLIARGYWFWLERVKGGRIDFPFCSQWPSKRCVSITKYIVQKSGCFLERSLGHTSLSAQSKGVCTGKRQGWYP